MEEAKIIQANKWANASLVVAVAVVIWLALIWLTPFIFVVHYTIGCTDMVLYISLCLFVIPLALAIISLSKKWTKKGAVMLHLCVVLGVLPLVVLLLAPIY